VTGVVRLRATIASDLERIYAFQADPEGARMAAFPSRDHAAFMAHWAKVLADERNLARTILCDALVVGTIGSFERDGRRQVGYWVDRAHWGRGIATQALSEFLRDERARPLFAFVAKHNVGSQRVLAKCGFVLCGEDRSAAPTGGEEVDEFLFRLDAGRASPARAPTDPTGSPRRC
jgi:RimJ/RimL family protein N-acetyltransferase